MDRHGIIQNIYYYIIIFYQVLPSDLFGCFKWPFQGLSDLHLGDQKVTWKKLVHRSATAPFLKTFQESQSRWSMHWRWSPGFPNHSVSISTGEFSSSHAFLVLFDEMIEMIKLLEYGRGSPVLTWAVFFLIVPCPIHWVNAYANASACLRGLHRVPTPEVFNTRCLRGCLRGVLCWIVMFLVSEDCIFELCSIFELLTFIRQFRHPDTAIRQ